MDKYKNEVLGWIFLVTLWFIIAVIVILSGRLGLPVWMY